MCSVHKTQNNIVMYINIVMIILTTLFLSSDNIIVTNMQQLML